LGLEFSCVLAAFAAGDFAETRYFDMNARTAQSPVRTKKEDGKDNGKSRKYKQKGKISIVKKSRIINFVGVLTLIFAVFLSVSFGQEKSAPKAAEKPLPNLVLDTIDGKKWSLYENRGRVVIINFWATWCEPCRTETPMLVDLGKKYKKQGLEIVGIALDENGTEIIKKFVAEYKIDYPILLPVPGSLLAQIDPVPTTLLIDAEGRLAKKYVGAMPEDLLTGHIEALIKKPGAKNAAGKK
jgi:thiol-disulfide isomerase/thioredoxin